MTIQLNDPGLWQTQAHINGKWVASDSGKTFGVIDPANGEHLADVPDMGAAETARAIDTANAALPAWRAKTAKERASVLRKWFDLCLAAKDDLALLMTREQGKPLAEASGEVVYGASFLECLPKKANASMATSFHPMVQINASLPSNNRLALLPRSRPGTSRWQ